MYTRAFLIRTGSRSTGKTTGLLSRATRESKLLRKIVKLSLRRKLKPFCSTIATASRKSGQPRSFSDSTKMQDIIDATTGPFLVTVGIRCDSHIQRPRRPIRCDAAGIPYAENVSAAQHPGPASAIPDGVPVKFPAEGTKELPAKPGLLFD